ncbi:MAG: VWA domain-containing protein [Alphaproteobacteria bacterium]|nr:MAG: VWA domain-containing protein [Alphaproteobacteria bacterium]
MTFRKMVGDLLCKLIARLFPAGAAHRAMITNTSGAVMIVFGLAVIPLVGFVGAAVDFANAYQLRSRLQNALDAAALAAGREMDLGSTEANARQTANRVLEVNLGPDFPRGYSAQFTFSGSRIQAHASVNVSTYFMGILGTEVLPVGASSTVSLAGGTLEVVMVLDNSGSMRGSKLADLKNAARNLTQILFQSNNDPDRVRIGIVPFAATVNVGTQYANASWMDTNAQSSIHNENFSPPTNRFTLFNNLRGASWGGCVETRPSPHDVTDTAPVGGDTLFVPYFAPDEPDRRFRTYYANNYINDNGGSCPRRPRNQTQEQAQENSCKYNRARVSSRAPGPNYLCDSQPITPLTNSQATVMNAISNMVARGRTNIHQGVMWGWRVLSPGEPFTEGRRYDVADNRKFMIVMTDGANTHRGRSNQNMSDYSAYGYSKHERLRAATRSTSRLVQAMNSRTSTTCTNAKAAGITVFTIAFAFNDPATLAMLRNCASGSARAFRIDNGNALIAVFEAIAGEINRLVISS